MATSNKRTIYLGLDYSEFTGGVSEVNRKMGLLDAEFKLAQEQAKNYGNETDALGTKHDYLTQKIALQSQKLDAAKRAYEEAAASGNVNEKQLDALQKRVIQEATALERMNGQLKDTDNEMKRADDATKSFGDEIRDMAGLLGANVSPAVEKLAKKFDGVNAAAGNAVLGIGALVGSLIKCSKEAAENADELLTMSSTTGMSVEQLQKLEYASKFVDVELSTLSGSMTKLTSSMYQAREGSEGTAEVFKKLHIRTTDASGALRDSNAVFYEVIDALGRVTNETERDAAAMKLFGKSAKELNPLIEAGSQTLQNLGDEAESLGVVMGENDVKSLGKLKDAMDKFESTTSALKNNLGLVLLPILTRLFEVIASIPAPILQTLVTLATVIATIVMVVKAIKSMTDTGKTIKSFFDKFNGSGAKTTLIIVGIVAALIALAAIIAVIIGKGDDLNRTMANIGDQTAKIGESVTGAQSSVARTQMNASGVESFAGGRTWINEGEPEVVTLPSGSQITPVSQLAGNETNNYYITIDAKSVSDFNRVVQLAEQQKMAVRRM